jgi:hypothetical protein
MKGRVMSEFNTHPPPLPHKGYTYMKLILLISLLAASCSHTKMITDRETDELLYEVHECVEFKEEGVIKLIPADYYVNISSIPSDEYECIDVLRTW